MTIFSQAQTQGQPQQAAAQAVQDAQASARDMQVRAQDLRDQAQALRDRARDQLEVQSQTGYDHQRRDRGQQMGFAGFVIFIVAAVIILRPVARALARRMEGARPVTDAAGNDTRETLQRMEHAIDAMAIEIERISENQRFTTKLLSGRDDPKVPASVPASVQNPYR